MHAIAKFHVNQTFELLELELFVLAGSVVEGRIKVGMVVNVTINAQISIAERIERIELARREGGEDLCLCIKVAPEMAETWRGLAIGNETLEVTTGR